MDIKQKLSEFNFKSLCLNEDDFVFKSIAEKTKTSGRIIGVIVQRFDEKKPDGIAITEIGLEWTASMLSSYVSKNGKKVRKPGDISFKELAHFKFQYEEEILMNKMQLNRIDLTNPDLLEISFDCDKETDKDQISELFEFLVNIETIEEIIPDEKRVDYLEAFIIEENKNPIMNFIRMLINTDYLVYKQAFAKYSKKSSWTFFYQHNISAIIGWAFSLLYRKVYVLGAIFIVIVFIALFSIPDPGGLIIAVLIMAIQSLISPFIIYKRYSGILKHCSNNKFSEEQTIEELKKKGGSNGYLAVIAGIAIIISIVINIISAFSG